MIPTSALWVILAFALLLLIIATMYFGYALALKQQLSRFARFAAFLQLKEEEEEARWVSPVIHEIEPLHEGGGEKGSEWVLGGGEGVGVGAHKDEWEGGLPVSLLPLPHPPSQTRVLAMTAPPIAMVVLIAHPRPPPPPPPPSRQHVDATPLPAGEAAGQVVGSEGSEEDAQAEEKMGDLELGVTKVAVHGDWRVVVGRTTLGFLD